MLDKLPKVRGEYRKDFKLANVTWFNVGGIADVLYKPADIEDLQKFLREKPAEIPYIVIGVGSNLLVRDGGFRGVVIKLGREFAKISHQNNILQSGTSVLDINVSRYCEENSLAGLEFLSGIPGVIGAAVAMNAGAYGREISDCLVKVDALDIEGNLITLSNEECKFEYRGNALDNKFIFVQAYFSVSKGDRNEISEKITNIQRQREGSQPIRAKTGGSTFKNPLNLKAWQLIDDAGCRGLRNGDAMISEKHCNFLINLGNATAKDIEDLGELVREKVYKNSGIMLEWEIKILGENQKSL